MKELLRFKYRRVILSFVVVLIIFLSIVVAVIITHQREMFEDSQRNARRELELIGTFTRESLIRRDYANVEQFLKLWGQEHAEVVSIKATAPNNFILVDYTRREPSENSFLVKQHINYEGRDLISLEMVKDITHLKRSLNKFMVQLITGSVLLTIMLGVTLWYALKKLALIPLAKEIATREEAEKKFRMLLESVPDALILVFNDGKIIMVNRAAERLFGYSRAEMLGKEIEMLMPESLREIHRKFREEYLSSPRVRHMGEGLDLFGLAKDGREFPVDIGLSPIDSDEGVFVIADIRDISNRKRAEEKIKRSYHFKSAISSILQISLEPVPMEEQLERILDVILSIPAFSIESKGCIYLVEEEPHVLVMKAESGLPQAVKTSCALVPFASSLCGMAVSERKIMFSECIDDRHEIHHENMFPHGHYCIPVISGDIVLGAINLFVKEGHKRDKEEEDL
ncbi:MAG: PAS domain S-box protein, partial [Nitrospirota bacterium]